MAQLTVKSPRFSFIPEDLKSILKGAGIAAGGAGLTYLAQNLSSLNFGEYTPLIVAVLSILINSALKYIGVSKYAR